MSFLVAHAKVSQIIVRAGRVAACIGSVVVGGCGPRRLNCAARGGVGELVGRNGEVGGCHGSGRLILGSSHFSLQVNSELGGLGAMHSDHLLVFSV